MNSRTRRTLALATAVAAPVGIALTLGLGASAGGTMDEGSALTSSGPTTAAPSSTSVETTVPAATGFIDIDRSLTAGQVFTVSAGPCLINGHPFGVGYVFIVSASDQPGPRFHFLVDNLDVAPDGNFAGSGLVPAQTPAGRYIASPACHDEGSSLPIDAFAELTIAAAPVTPTTTTTLVGELPKTS